MESQSIEKVANWMCEAEFWLLDDKDSEKKKNCTRQFPLNA